MQVDVQTKKLPTGAWIFLVAQTQQSSKLNAQLRALAATLPDVLARAPAPPAAHTRQRQRRLTAAQVAQLVAAYQAGADMKTLAQRWGVHRQTVAAHLRQAGVPLRQKGLTPEQIAEAASLYAGGWTLARLGGRYGCHPTVVLRAFQRTGTPRRDSHGR